MNMMINCKYALVSFFIGLMSVHANLTIQEHLDNPLSREKRVLVSTPIELENFLEPAMLLPPNVTDVCLVPCFIIPTTNQYSTRYVECQNFSSNNLGEYCEKYPKITWAEDGNGEVYGHGTKCSDPEDAAGNDCETCLCIREGDRNIFEPSVRFFSLRPQVSDVDNNMIVTGLMFKLLHTMIHLQIRQSKLLPDGSVSSESSWKDLDDIVTKSSQYGPEDWTDLELNVDYLNFTAKQRTLFFDNILLPQGYVVTGVNFAKVDSSTGHSGLKVRVKGSKIQYPSHELIDDPNEWFDDDNNYNKDTSYDRPREEINSRNLDRPRSATEGIEILGTNRFIVFRTTDLKKDLGNHVIPYLIGDPIESNVPLKGVGLSYRHKKGYGGYVSLKAFPLHLSNSSGSTVTPTTSTDDSVEVISVSSKEDPDIDLTNIDLPPVVAVAVPISPPTEADSPPVATDTVSTSPPTKTDPPPVFTNSDSASPPTGADPPPVVTDIVSTNPPTKADPPPVVTDIVSTNPPTKADPPPVVTNAVSTSPSTDPSLVVTKVVFSSPPTEDYSPTVTNAVPPSVLTELEISTITTTLFRAYNLERTKYYDNNKPVARLQNNSPTKYQSRIVILIFPLWIKLLF